MKYKIYLFTLIFASCLCLQTIAQPTGWLYAVPITVTNTNSVTVTNYQLNVMFNTQTPIAASQMLPAGDDIRFGKTCDGSVLYNYWIESGINTTNTSLWVNIDTLFASSSRTFYIFYGNSAATAVSALTGVFIGPLSSTDSIASGGSGGVGSSQRGFRFSPNENILMSHVGKYEPTGTTRYVTLFDFSSQAIISQQQVSGSAAQYSYAPLTTPIWLTQGTQYVLELFQGASDGYYFGTSSQINPHLTYYDMRYCNSCAQNTFPTSTLSGYQYGYPDIWFYIKNNNLSPIPTYTVYSALSVSITPTVNAICFADSVTLSATTTPFAGSGYNWQPGNLSGSTIKVSPTTSTVYTVITNISGCTLNISNTVSITVNNLPVIAINASPNDTICATNSVTLSGSGATSYTWSSGIANGVAFTPTITATYTVTGADVNNCSDTASMQIVVNNCTTGINNLLNNIVTIYPNPSNGEFIVSLNNSAHAFIEIYNSIGQLVISKSMNSATEQIKISNANNGLYLIRIMQNNTLMYQRNIVVNK